VETGGKWGFIDKTGEYKILPQFDSATTFDGNPLLAVRQDGVWKLLDREGVVIEEYRPSEAAPIPSYAPSSDDGYFYIRGGGNLILFDGETGIVKSAIATE
jgi:hypothetical protein